MKLATSSKSVKKTKTKANADKEEAKPVQTPAVDAVAVVEDKVNDKKSNNNNKSKKENEIKQSEQSNKENNKESSLSIEGEIEGLGLEEEKLQFNIERAVKSLLEVLERKKNEGKDNKGGKLSLLDDADDEVGEIIFVGFSLITTPEKGRLRGENILLPYSYRKENPSVCLFVNNKEKARQSLIDGVANGKMQEIKGLEKIISLQKLKTKFKEYQTRRDLKKKYDVFIGDSSISAKLPAALGKIFYSSPKRPLIKRFCENNAMKESAASIIEDALRTAVFFISGNNCTVRAGNVSMKVPELVENIKKVILDSVAHIVPNGWKNLRGIYIKAETAMNLPVYKAPAAAIAKIQNSSVKRPREKEGKGKGKAEKEDKTESAPKKQKNSKDKKTDKSNNSESKAEENKPVESDKKSDDKDDKMEEDKPKTPSSKGNGKEKVTANGNHASEAPKSEKKEAAQSTKKSKPAVEDKKEEKAEKETIEKVEPSGKKGKKANAKEAEVIKAETIPTTTPSKKEIEKSENKTSKTPKSVIKSESKKKTKV